MIDIDLKLKSQLVMIPLSISDIDRTNTKKENVISNYHKIEEEGKKNCHITAKVAMS